MPFVAGDVSVIMFGVLLASFCIVLARWRGEKAAGESALRFRTLAETASDAIVTMDASGTMVYVNPAAEQIFGHLADEMIGEPLTLLVPESLRSAHQAGFARYQSTNRRHMSWKAIELPGRHRRGHEIPLEISFGEFRRNGQQYFTGIVRDITERKRAEEALRRSREERAAELERVRRRIAADLHDDIGSSLTQIAILSEVIRQRSERLDTAMTTYLSTIGATSREIVDALSDIVWAIDPRHDHLHDLTQRMRRFAADTFAAADITCHFRLSGADDDVRLGANLRREIFLVFKEGINNVVRHAACTEADIQLTLVDGRLELCLSDNGRGFVLPDRSRGHGLTSMRDRAHALGGRFHVDSGPGLGTTMRLDVPVGPDRERSPEP
jgi:PAS domain S-box-containing protein